MTLDRQDGAKVATTIYQPRSGACVGSAIVSPGAGGSEKGYAYLAEGLRDEGWLVAVVDPAESGMKVVLGQIASHGLKAGLEAVVTDPKAYTARFMDIDAASKWTRAHCVAVPLVLLGHSMGAATVMLEAGAQNKLGLTGNDAFDAYVALSPQGPGSIFPAGAWGSIRKPVLILTGTRDGGLDGDWTTRTKPFDDMPIGCKWLGVIDGATHLNFAGIGASGKTERLTTLTVGRFLDGVRQGTCGAPLDESGMKMQTHQ